MNKFANAAKRFGGFMKRNAFYFLIVLCIASVATVIALAVTRNTPADNPIINTPDDDDPGGEVINPDDPNDELTFISPVNSGTILNDFEIDDMVFNPTIDQWSTHNGVDYVSDDLNVYCVADGKIKETGSDDLNGNYVIIEHEDGYETGYYSLETACPLAVGSEIAQGSLLGKMSTSQGLESLLGAHLHFEMLKDGEYINPASVIAQDEK